MGPAEGTRLTMFAAPCLVFLISVGAAFGSNCEHIGGQWQNQLGSNMTVLHQDEHRITGEYSTAVVTELNAALVTSNITGVFRRVEGGALLSFSVLFNHGKSLTTWVGQCCVCEGEEVLYTTWILRGVALKASDKWMSVMIHQDTFKRMGKSHQVPHHLMGPSKKDARSSSCEKNINVGPQGHWSSESQDVLQFEQCHESGVVLGSNKGAAVFGRSSNVGSFTAFGLSASPTSLDSVKGWIGHIYESPSDKRTIESSWLLHKFSNSCKNPRSHVMHGMDNYMFTYGKKDSAHQNESGWQKFLNSIANIPTYMRSLF